MDKALLRVIRLLGIVHRCALKKSSSVRQEDILDEASTTAQLWPHIHGTDAMFLALFRKN